jgi:GT2 family glycosyltransferase
MAVVSVHNGAPPRCSVIIPVYNRASMTRQCLSTLLNQPAEVDYEIIVVDDGSRDSTPRLLAGYGDRLRVVTHTTNRGFSSGCNDGAAIANGEYLIFLNNDTLPLRGWLDALVRYADAQPAAMVGGKLLFPNDTIQHAGVTISQDRYPRHLYAGFPADHPAVNRSRRMQIVTAAAALIRHRVFDEMGGFDTAFMNGYEDVDLCLRLNERGYEVHYCHEAELYHFESVSEGRFDQLQHNTHLYFSRWGGKIQPDDLAHYLADGLLKVSYNELYPAQISIAPLLAHVRSDERDRQLEDLLERRARQVYDLLKENIRLTIRWREAEDTRGAVATPRTVSFSPAATPATPPAETPVVVRGRVHDLAGGTNGPFISVILPTKNGAARLRELLPRVLTQQCNGRVEIIAVDSGSDDDTITLLRQFDATVIAIDSRSFNHGLTRGLAAGHARGDVLVFVNQSTLPADNGWLANLVAPILCDPDLAGVCSRVLPRPEADLLVRKDSLRNASAAEQRTVRAITDWNAYRRLTPHELRLFINFHTVSAAIRPQVLLRVPFRAVRIGEDILWAKEVLEAGYKIQHEPSSAVYHSHQYGYLDILRRNVDDGYANRAIVGRQLPDHEVAPLIDSLIREDWAYLEDERGLKATDLEHWRHVAAVRRTAQVIGQWLGVNQESQPNDLSSLLSLTEWIKAGAAAPGRG